MRGRRRGEKEREGITIDTVLMYRENLDTYLEVLYWLLL